MYHGDSLWFGGDFCFFASSQELICWTLLREKIYSLAVCVGSLPRGPVVLELPFFFCCVCPWWESRWQERLEGKKKVPERSLCPGDARSAFSHHVASAIYLCDAFGCPARRLAGRLAGRCGRSLGHTLWLFLNILYCHSNVADKTIRVRGVFFYAPACCAGKYLRHRWLSVPDTTGVERGEGRN